MDLDIKTILKKNILTTLSQFVNEIDISFDYIDKTIIKSLYKLLSSLENDETFFTEIHKLNSHIDLYINDITNIVNSVRKIKKQDFDFLNNINLFDLLEFKLFDLENKNTKKTLVEHLHNISCFTNIFILFQNGDDVQSYLDKFIQSTIPPEQNIETPKFKSNKQSKSNKSNNNNNELNDLFNNLLNNPSIMNIAQDLSNNLEHDNINPMNLLSSIMSGKPNPTLNKLTKTIEDKINSGELDTQELQAQAENIMNITKNNNMLSSILQNHKQF